MAFDIPLEYVAFIAIILGTLGRTYFPFLRKTEQMTKGETIDFELKYVVTAIFSSIVTAIFVYPLFVFTEGTSLLTVFISGFIFSWGANDVTNRLAHSTATTTTDEGTTTLTVDASPASELKFAPEKP